MIRTLRLLATLGILGLPAASRAQDAPTLNVGDPAPKLAVKEFIQGEPVSGFAKGKVYVVEFWATWCGPCRATIPHLSELQKKYPDVTFLGVSVWENDPKAVRPFVKEMGDKMTYRVAIDAVPEGGAPNEGPMARDWMEAAGEDGIPASFLIDRDGKVAWIGHPMALDGPLEAVVKGTYDLKAAVAERQAEKLREARLAKLEARLAQAAEKGDPKAMVAVLDQAIQEDPTLEAELGAQKFEILLGMDDPKPAIAYGRKLVEGALKDDAEGLNALAWSIVAPEAERKPNKEMTALALAAARRADTLEEGKNPFIADTLAKALFDSGDLAKALETQQKAMTLAKGTPLEDDAGMKERLEQYKKAVAARKGEK